MYSHWRQGIEISSTPENLMTPPSQEYSLPVKKYSQVLLPVLVPEPVKVNPLELAGGEEESSFQRELSEGSWEFLNKKKRGINDWFIYLKSRFLPAAPPQV